MLSIRSFLATLGASSLLLAGCGGSPTANAAADAQASKRDSIIGPLQPVFRYVSQGVLDIAYDATHQIVWAAPYSQNGTVIAINPKNGAVSTPITLPAAALQVSMNGTGDGLLIGCADGKVRLVDTSSYGITETITVPDHKNPVVLLALAGTKDSFIVNDDPWSYVFDGSVQRRDRAALGLLLTTSGANVTGGDYRYSPAYIHVGQVTPNGIENVVQGVEDYTTQLLTQDNYPMSSDGVVVNPANGQLAFNLPVIPTEDDNRIMAALPDGKSVFCITWDPKTAQVINVATNKSTSTFSLPQTDGGCSKVIWAGPDRIVYFTFGYINDRQVVIGNVNIP